MLGIPKRELKAACRGTCCLEEARGIPKRELKEYILAKSEASSGV